MHLKLLNVSSIKGEVWKLIHDMFIIFTLRFFIPMNKIRVFTCEFYKWNLSRTLLVEGHIMYNAITSVQ